MQIATRLKKKSVHVIIEPTGMLKVSNYTFELSRKHSSVVVMGEHYILPTSYGVSVLTDIILLLTTKGDSKQIEISAVNFVRKMGVPANLKGYHLLVTAICLAVYHMEYIWNTEMLYCAVAQNCNVSKSCVERCIRKAVEKAYDNSPEQVQSVFYYKITKPYCSEVISLAADSIRREHFFDDFCK